MLNYWSKCSSRVTFIAEFPVADAISGIVQFAKIAGDNRAAAEALVATMSQRLIRTLCKDCRLAYRPNPKIARQDRSATRDEDSVPSPLGSPGRSRKAR